MRMQRLQGRGKLRGRRKIIPSKQRIITWAKKQKHKNTTQSINPPHQPLVCPLLECTGTGHVDGIALQHVTLSACPLYHNLSFEKWAEMRAREEGLAPPSSRTLTPLPSSGKLNKASLQNNQLRTSMKEPLLDDLATSVEIYQFRCAQQRVVMDQEKEAKEHLSLCARIASYNKTSESDPLDLRLKENYASHANDLASHTKDGCIALKQRIRSVVFGDWLIDTVYPSAYLPELACLPVIYVCEFCLTPMRCEVAYERHRNACTWKSSPGREIYQKGSLSFFEVDGETNPDYCRDLCLLAKLFLKHKTVHEIDQVPSFLFYILTDCDAKGLHHIIGYFSKQKLDGLPETNSNTTVYNNLSCILTLPPYQCQGYGRMLIEMSYVLSLKENRIGSPERPLSDPGLILYRKYWKWEILNFLSNYSDKKINIRTMSSTLGIAIPDIVSTLLDMKMLVYFRTEYYIVNSKSDVSRLLASLKPPNPLRCIDKSCLNWTPPVEQINGKSTH